jgi:phosphoribosylformimino-5-aminoimidazole carboxamide ribotide isomerase
MAKMPFQVIPVLDLKHGQAVHAVGGRRDHYQLVRSVLHADSDPVALARALRDALGLHHLYLADLDAIAGCPPQLDIIWEIMGLGLHVWIDAGVRDVASSAAVLELDRSSCTIVAGLETVRGPRELTGILGQAGAERVVLSLDLFDGRPRMAVPGAWETDDPWELAQQAIERGVHRVLVIDLSRVGTSRGLGTETLMARIREAHPEVELSAGGGLSRIEEVLDLKKRGAAGALIGSALHDGRIGARDLATLEPGVA